MTDKTITDTIKTLETQCPGQMADPEGYRRNIERRAALSDKRRAYQEATGWKVA